MFRVAKRFLIKKWKFYTIYTRKWLIDYFSSWLTTTRVVCWASAQERNIWMFPNRLFNKLFFFFSSTTTTTADQKKARKCNHPTTWIMPSSWNNRCCYQTLATFRHSIEDFSIFHIKQEDNAIGEKFYSYEQR